MDATVQVILYCVIVISIFSSDVHGVDYCYGSYYCEDGYHCCDNNTQCCSDTFTGAIVGIVIGCIALISCCVSVICCVRKHRQQPGQTAQPAQQPGVAMIATGQPQDQPGYGQPMYGQPMYGHQPYGQQQYDGSNKAETNNPAYPPPLPNY
ncbi:uncharacterized protein LOC128556484 [Mercenaria mercenaria]|uniref:uncharacterized protein LOC128556484 n=1 Tax=Mercenaria mercenaria TaxID=6596 RepID=UPI00234F08E7|nr:uncharacterized protein LOC128556484 [Mercenaria mercenaria]